MILIGDQKSRAETSVTYSGIMMEILTMLIVDRCHPIEFLEPLISRPASWIIESFLNQRSVYFESGFIQQPYMFLQLKLMVLGVLFARKNQAVK